jgi:hypothetical protein
MRANVESEASPNQTSSRHLLLLTRKKHICSKTPDEADIDCATHDVVAQRGVRPAQKVPHHDTYDDVALLLHAMRA